MDHNTTRERETIRHNKSESYGTKYLETGSRDSMQNVVWWFWECRIRPEMCGNARKCAKLCVGLRIELLSLGSNISAQIMSAKLEWVLRNVTIGLTTEDGHSGYNWCIVLHRHWLIGFACRCAPSQAPLIKDLPSGHSMASLPPMDLPSHPLQKLVLTHAKRYISMHCSPLHELVHIFSIIPQDIETILLVSTPPPNHWLRWKTVIHSSVEELAAHANSCHSEVIIYLDGSGIGGSTGAAVVLYRARSACKILKLHLGSLEDHTTFEVEVVSQPIESIYP